MGTPDGIGFRREPQVFLKDGDEDAVEITGLGCLCNRVPDEATG
jgi:acylpyruvate hydrolase